MLGSLVTVAALSASLLAGSPAHTLQPCQYDASGHTVYVLAMPTQGGEPVRVRHHGHHAWHVVGHLPATGRGDFRTHRPVGQFSIDVKVGAQRCETT